MASQPEPLRSPEDGATDRAAPPPHASTVSRLAVRATATYDARVPIRATFFDFGGVILSSPFEAFNAFEERNGLPRDFIRTINSTNPDTNAWARFERSEATFDEFCELFEAEFREPGHVVTADRKSVG